MTAFMAWLGLPVVFIPAGIISFLVVAVVLTYLLRDEIGRDFSNFVLMLFFSALIAGFSTVLWPVLIAIGLIIGGTYFLWFALLKEKSHG